MVGLFKVLLSSLLLATFAAAQDVFAITQPSPTMWWVAKSDNVMAWNCQTDPSITNFTVLINNTNPVVLAGPLAFIAQLPNADCSYQISQDQVNQSPSTGYTLIFADPFNNTHIYATSQQFEIRAVGSAYPTSSIASAASGTASSSSSSSSTTPSTAAALGAHNPSSIGLAGVMGLLVAAVLGA